MKFFLDTADTQEIKDLYATGMVDGVTTNPSLVARSGKKFLDVIGEIVEIVEEGDISAECISTDYDNMLGEGLRLAKISPKIVVKVPLTLEGLRVCKALSAEGIGVNVTLCFSPVQALLAAKAGAKYISPFVGRHDDWGREGMEVVEEICTIYDNYAYCTQVLVASVRSVAHVLVAAKSGAEVATIPPKILRQLYEHPYTNLGLESFQKDWDKSGQKM